MGNDYDYSCDCDDGNCDCLETLDAWEYQNSNKGFKWYNDDGDEQNEHDKQYNG